MTPPEFQFAASRVTILMSSHMPCCTMVDARSAAQTIRFTFCREHLNAQVKSPCGPASSAVWCAFPQESYFHPRRIRSRAHARSKAHKVPITAQDCPPDDFVSEIVSRRMDLAPCIELELCLRYRTLVATSAWFGHLVAGRRGRVARHTRRLGCGGLGL